jgi:hypothetical protein
LLKLRSSTWIEMFQYGSALLDWSLVSGSMVVGESNVCSRDGEMVGR